MLPPSPSLPGAFPRRGVFYYLEFPDVPLMRKIIAAHHSHLEAKLLDQVVLKFYRLREQHEPRKRPSDHRRMGLD